MDNSGSRGVRQKSSSNGGLGQVSPEHYIRLILYRKWLVLGVFGLITAVTDIVSSQMPDVYSSETVILVDPQKVPDSYVKATVTGDVRNRLGTLSQQILSATRLQKIIDNLNLYPVERKTMPREDVITEMRKDISVNVLSDFGGGQDLQAFRIKYSGRDPRLVAQVTNELASLFIEENLKAREQQATGTTEFLENQLQETRKALEAQEAKLKEFKLKHIGEMPEQQAATLQVLGQLQSQLQLESDALGRAEQQRTYIQSMLAQSAPVVDVDEFDGKPQQQSINAPAPKQSPLGVLKARLAALQGRYSDLHPEIQRLKRQIADEEAKEGKEVASASALPAAAPAAPPSAAPSPQAARKIPVPPKYVNPVLEAQLRSMDAEIKKHKDEQLRLSRLVASYTAKVEAIPVREQQIADLARDYEISKAHYSQLLEKQLSAQTATQLEIRQKGEKFSILDPAQPAERPSRPNRLLINVAGAVVGLGLGLLMALATEFLGMSITSPDQITASTGIQVLEVIPIISTHADKVVRKKRIMLAALSGMAAMLVGGVVVLFHYRNQLF
jgi:polysaccharide chain length determinant protein (PEP-CTERM system associated)